MRNLQTPVEVGRTHPKNVAMMEGLSFLGEHHFETVLFQDMGARHVMVP